MMPPCLATDVPDDLPVGSFFRIDFCLIFVPSGHCDEAEVLCYENP
jgi:hypothetical protein